MGKILIGLILATLFFNPFYGFCETQPALKLGIHPYLSSIEIVKRFSPLADYLGKKTGRKVEIEISNSYDEHIKKVGSNKIDIAFMGPVGYVDMVSLYGKKNLLGSFETKGKKTFQGMIIVKSDSPITSIKQLKGKSFAFGDRESTMSHIVPRHMLLKDGLDVKDFKEYKFLTNHDNIAMGVLAGDFDAGAVKDEVFKKYEEKGLKSIAVSPDIFDHIFVATDRLPADILPVVRDAMLGLKDSEEGRRILAGIKSDLTALIPVSDGDYALLRKIVMELRNSGVK